MVQLDGFTSAFKMALLNIPCNIVHVFNNFLHLQSAKLDTSRTEICVPLALETRSRSQLEMIQLVTQHVMV